MGVIWTIVRSLFVLGVGLLFTVWTVPLPSSTLPVWFVAFVLGLLLTAVAGVVLSVRLFFSNDANGRQVAVGLAGFASALWVGIPGVVGFMGGLLGVPSQRWWRRLIAALCGVVLAHLLTGPVRLAADRYLIQRHRAVFENVVRTMSPASDNGIEHRIADRVNAMVREAGYYSVINDDDYVMFIRDGFLDNSHGVLCVLPHHRQPRRGDRTSNGLEFTRVEYLEGCWYRFSTT